jgi:serine/threonine protein phosphatase PrpC
MTTFFTKTAIGFSHVKENKVCQDFSASYHDEERTIITACDGHGGDIYVRSHLGSKFASESVIKALKEIEKSDFYKYSKREICDKIKIRVLCEWNALVERHLNGKGLGKSEVAHLGADRIFKLKRNPEKAYGTTLNGAMIFGNKLICVSIGDGGIFLVRKGEIYCAVEEDEDAVANVTYSMCNEDAYEHMKVEVYDFSSLDGVLLCTDGLINPYRSVSNFNEHCVKPIVLSLTSGKQSSVEKFVEEMGLKLGSGDDVTLSIAIKDNVSIRRYKSQ